MRCPTAAGMRWYWGMWSSCSRFGEPTRGGSYRWPCLSEPNRAPSAVSRDLYGALRDQRTTIVVQEKPRTPWASTAPPSCLSSSPLKPDQEVGDARAPSRWSAHPSVLTCRDSDRRVALIALSATASKRNL